MKDKDKALDKKLQNIVDGWEFDKNVLPPLRLNDLIDVIAEKSARLKGKKEIK